MKPFIELYFTVLYRVEGGRPNGVCGASFPSQVTSLDMTPCMKLRCILPCCMVLYRPVLYQVAGCGLDDVTERHAQTCGVIGHDVLHRVALHFTELYWTLSYSIDHVAGCRLHDTMERHY